MSDLLKSMALASSGMKAQAGRIRHVAENIANADTPGYRRKTASFATTYHEGLKTGAVQLGPLRLDPSDLKTIYDPSHPLANESGHYQGSNVELMIEIADSREAQRSYEANLKMFDQARQMSAALLDLLRK